MQEELLASAGTKDNSYSFVGSGTVVDRPACARVFMMPRSSKRSSDSAALRLVPRAPGGAMIYVVLALFYVGHLIIPNAGSVKNWWLKLVAGPVGQGPRSAEATESPGLVTALSAASMVNVKDFGAKGDGIADDAVSINAALATLTSGGTAFIPPGIYRVSKPLTPLSNTQLVGAGSSTTILADAAVASRVILVESKHYVTVRDLKVDGGDPTRPRYCVSLDSGSSYARIEAVSVVRCGQYGLAVVDKGTSAGAAGHVIRNNVVDMTGALIKNTPIGIEVFPRGGAGYLADPGILVEGNTVIGDDQTLDGIKINAQRGCRIVANYVSGASHQRSEGGINLLASRHCTVVGNTVHGAKNAYVASGMGTPDNRVRNEYHTWTANVARGFTQNGFYASGGSTGQAFTNNIIDRDTGQGKFGFNFTPGADGIGFDQLTIAGNTLNGVGIYLRQNGSGRFSQPRVLNNGIYGSPGVGIHLDGDDAQVTFNHVRGAQSHGVVVNGARGQFVGNKILDCNTGNATNVGGLVANGPDAQIFDNHIENLDGGVGRMKFGVILREAPSARIRDNRIIRTGTREILSNPRRD
jgi:Pectate lyase superfamily protein